MEELVEGGRGLVEEDDACFAVWLEAVFVSVLGAEAVIVCVGRGAGAASGRISAGGEAAIDSPGDLEG